MKRQCESCHREFCVSTLNKHRGLYCKNCFFDILKRENINLKKENDIIIKENEKIQSEYLKYQITHGNNVNNPLKKYLLKIDLLTKILSDNNIYIDDGKKKNS